MSNQRIEFRAEPIVVGVLGSADDAAHDWLTRAEPRADEVVIRPDLAVRSSHPLSEYQNSTQRGWYWTSGYEGPAAGDWLAAQRGASGAGFGVDGEAVFVHNDRLGFRPLYYVQRDGVVAFSNSMSALEGAVESVRPDPIGWASLLVLGFCMPGYSTTSAIRTLPAGGRLASRSGEIVVERTNPAVATPVRGDIGDFVGLLRDALPSTNAVSVTLSGGLDSRLIVALLPKRRLRRLHCWTTSTDDGIDAEIDVARLVASRVRARHHVVEPSLDSWSTSSDVALDRLDHMTYMHPWIVPLAADLRAFGRPVVDGFAGDVLLKPFRQDPANDARGGHVDARVELWSRLGGERGAREEMWSPSARRLFEDVGFESFDECIRDFADEPAWQNLAALTTRLARGVSLSALRLFGPELDVWLPFMADPVLDLMLSPEMNAQRRVGLRREILGTLDRKLADIPTPERFEPARVPHPRRVRQQGSVAHIVDNIAAVEPALDLLSPALREHVVNRNVPRLARAIRNWGPYWTLLAVNSYARWHLQHPEADRGILNA